MNILDVDITEKVFTAPPPAASVTAINRVRFSMPPGQFTSVIGPSGCGKTTLLHLISGLDTRVEGMIAVSGQPPADHQSIGYMFQSPRLMPWLTVLENVRLVANAQALMDGRAELLLTDMKLEKCFDMYPNRLSGGMQRRVALARAFVNEPPLLLLDEPFISLDEPVADRLRELLLSLWSKRRASVLFVTHDLREALFLSDRILFMSASPGTIVLDQRVNLRRPRVGDDSEMEDMRHHLLAEHPALLAGLAREHELEGM